MSLVTILVKLKYLLPYVLDRIIILVVVVGFGTSLGGLIGLLLKCHENLII